MSAVPYGHLVAFSVLHFAIGVMLADNAAGHMTLILFLATFVTSVSAAKVNGYECEPVARLSVISGSIS